MSDPVDPTQHTESGALKTHSDEEAYCPGCNKSYPMTFVQCPEDGARLVKLKATRDPLIGRVFEGRYEIRTALGEGGMGTVYRGWQLSVDREVAIKVVHPSIASDRTAVKRFLREARLSSRLSQPSIVNVYDFGQTDDGILYLVMELLRGHTLAKALEPKKPLHLRRVITMALQLCDALEAAHGSGIIHRDLKPGNIVVLDDPPGRDLVKVLDFGLAKSLISDSSTNVTHTNAILGTPLYMSPEQIEGRATDARSDLYALGCILFHMLVGSPPFLADNATLVLAAHLSDPVPPLPASTPRALVMLVERLMAKRADERLASAALVRDTLTQVADAGYGASDLSDTTPDIPPMVVRDYASGPVRASRTSDLALAMTDPALRHPPAGVPLDSSSASTPAPLPRSRRMLVIAVAGALAVGIAIVLAVVASKKSPSAASRVDAGAFAIDATRAMTVPADSAAPIDAAAPPIDASTPVDAAVLGHVDAGTRAHPDARHYTPPAVPIDAGVKRVPPPIDAAGEPNIDFLPTKKK